MGGRRIEIESVGWLDSQLGHIEPLCGVVLSLHFIWVTLMYYHIPHGDTILPCWNHLECTIIIDHSTGISIH